jgi:phage gpG-like protein
MASLVIDIGGLEPLRAALDRIATPDWASLWDAVGAEVADQTQERIVEHKRTPDGVPWKPWSPAYAATRHANHSLLRNEGHMLEAITHFSSRHQAEVGVRDSYRGDDMVYARRQNAARQFLGLSATNEEDLERVVADYLEERFGGAA